VTPVRTIELDPAGHRLRVLDELEGEGEHLVEIPLQLAPGIEPVDGGAGVVMLAPGFVLTWADPGDWRLEIGSGWVSPSYGVRIAAPRLVWSRHGALRPLRVEIAAS